ncbi:MAG: hypothetical protein IPM77_14700 [Crocinitomicaceae bacterium]|nr:hypothetical protein [Crocinitomicaceae bacterium]
MKKILLALTILTSGFSFSQNEFIAYPATGKGVSSTFVTDYHALGINPANLGWQSYEKSVTMGSSEFGMSIHSDSLAKQDLRDNIWGAAKFKTLDSMSREEKMMAINGFASDFAFNWDYNMFGASYQNEKFGGIAFSIRSRATWASSFSPEFSELLFNGQFSNQFDSLQYWNGTDTVNIANYGSMSTDSSGNVIGGTANIPVPLSDIVGDSYLRLSLNREYHVGYGRKILNVDSVFTLYGGIGFKFIQGIAIMDLSNENGNLQMFSAFSPGFQIDYAAGLNSLPQQAQNFWRSSVGTGYGLDFGANMTFFNKLHVAASVTNIGSMTYTGNVFSAVDTLVVGFSREGLEDMNIANSVPEMLEGSGLFTLEDMQEYKVSLPGTLRFGASIELGKFAHIGAEIVSPFNDVPGSINGFAYGLGGDIKLAQGKIILMAGLTGGGGYDMQVPMGINFCFGEGAYEVGIASRDAVTFFVQNSPTISAAFGFARVRF